MVARTPLPESQMGPAERLLDVVLGSSAHLWHNRPGLNVGGTWKPAKNAGKPNAERGVAVKPGLFVPAAVALYARLLEIHKLNADLMAHLASYALVETDWRDLKVACAALMLVQTRSGAPVRDDDGSVAFYDDDHRRIGEAMVLWYQKKSARMLTPKAVLRIAELLETPEIAALNRGAGFGDPAAKRAPLGRWAKAAAKWLAMRETNRAMLEGLVKAGYKETIKNLARKIGYKPAAPEFFGILGWKQAQADDGRREIGLDNATIVKAERFDGLSEAEICETIVARRLRYKDAVGRLPADIGLTPAIMVALLPTLSDRDLRQLTPTLEELGLLSVPEIRARWEKSIETATDQRGLNIAKNVRDDKLKEKLADSADNAAKKAVAAASREVEIRVMFLVDKSGSMQGAIESSKDALGKILAGFPLERLHVAAFDTMGQVLRPKAASRAAVQHMLAPIRADGGTIHGAGVQALHRDGLRVPAGAKLIVIVVGDEAGESGAQLAQTFRTLGYTVDAMALLLAGSPRGSTVRDCAKELRVPYSEVNVAQFDDPYHVTRVLAALLEAPVSAAVPTPGLVEKVMATKLLEPPAGAA
ncbi:MAG: VWA domain-containing protein [Deltaproteobacteria bacterium]|nr:VWA domain-containing protein [Deltaproteobacteria bacterium]MCW5802915.1 VWA domain-containing protein [Deltaproteobacteria bacterium]